MSDIFDILQRKQYKLRVWDKACNTFVEARDLIFHNSGAISCGDVWCTGDMVICKFLGLLDSNGEEIYDGNIYKVSGTGLCIANHNASTGLEFIGSDGEWLADFLDCIVEHETIQLVGNIFEGKGKMLTDEGLV